ncbi:MAG: hypothetical protein GY928_21225 [Colwellia sp.]|nr:hypothetical protein [Colwellia sp.]
MKEVTIEAVEVNHVVCEGCMFEQEFEERHCGSTPDNLKQAGLPHCDDGYIYKIKEK